MQNVYTKFGFLIKKIFLYFNNLSVSLPFLGLIIYTYDYSLFMSYFIYSVLISLVSYFYSLLFFSTENKEISNKVIKSTYLPIFLPTYASVSPSIDLPVPPCVRPSVRPSIRSFVRPPVRPSARTSVRPSIRPYVRTYVRQSVCSSVRPSVRYIHPSIH